MIIVIVNFFNNETLTIEVSIWYSQALVNDWKRIIWAHL